jgi:hypothetical protein
MITITKVRKLSTSLTVVIITILVKRINYRTTRVHFTSIRLQETWLGIFRMASGVTADVYNSWGNMGNMLKDLSLNDFSFNMSIGVRMRLRTWLECYLKINKLRTPRYIISSSCNGGSQQWTDLPLRGRIIIINFNSKWLAIGYNLMRSTLAVVCTNRRLAASPRKTGGALRLFGTWIWKHN